MRDLLRDRFVLAMARWRQLSSERVELTIEIHRRPEDRAERPSERDDSGLEDFLGESEGGILVGQPPTERGGPQPRTPRAVINEAIRENAGWDRTCKCGVLVFGLTGAATIVAGAWQGNTCIGLVGAIAGYLCWPAVRYAMQIRKGNVALRMLELALNNVRTAEEALLAINQAFSLHFGEGEGRTGVAPRSRTQVARRSAEDR
jgi:hypothetical protein